MPTNYGQWNAIPMGLQSGMESFKQARELRKKHELEQQKLKAESAANSPAMTFEQAGLVAPGDPLAGQGLRQKDMLQAALGKQRTSTPEAAGIKQEAEGGAILAGAGGLGKLAKAAGKQYTESKNPLKSVVADVAPKLQSSFPSTAQKVAPELSAYLNNAQSTLDAIGRERSGGAITGDEWLSFRQFLPMPMDYEQGPEAVSRKLDGLVQRYRTKSQAYAQGIANPVARQQYEAQIDSNMDAIRQKLQNEFLGEEAAPATGGGFDPAAELARVRARRGAKP